MFRKKVLIAVIVFMMILAIAGTVYAASKTCYLHSYQTGSVATAKLWATTYTHFSAYNNTPASDTMMARFQISPDGNNWEGLTSVRLDAGDYYAPPSSIPVGIPAYFRTKIWSEHGAGGVEGIGCVFDY